MANATSGIVRFNKPVTLAFPQALFEAKKFKGGGRESGEPKYGASFVFPPDHPDFAILKFAALKLAQEKWPGRDIAADFKARQFKMPWSSGDAQHAKRVAKLVKEGKEDDGKADFLKGNIIVKSASKYPPRYSMVNGKSISDLEGPAILANKGKFYFGANVLAELNLVAYDKVGETGIDGVTAYLNVVCTLGTGKRLSGGASGSEAFAGYVGQMTAEDPTGGELEDVDSF
jgi:hypothetical protein